MKTYRDIPSELFTKDGSSVFVHGFIAQAQHETSIEMNEECASKILSNAINLAKVFVGPNYVNKWLYKYLALYAGEMLELKPTNPEGE